MKNYIQDITQITLAASKNVESGELVVVNNLVGVACTSAPKGETITLTTQGVFELPSAVKFDFGEEVYLVKDKLVKKADGASKVGICVGGSDSLVRVRIA